MSSSTRRRVRSASSNPPRSTSACSTTRDVAWRVQGTRRAWTIFLLTRLLGIPLGLAYAGAVFAAVHVIPVWLSPFLVVGSFAASIYGIYVQVSLLRRVFRLRRVLRTYPWQVFEGGLPHSVRPARSARGDPALAAGPGSKFRIRTTRIQTSRSPWMQTGAPAGG